MKAARLSGPFIWKNGNLTFHAIEGNGRHHRRTGSNRFVVEIESLIVYRRIVFGVFHPEPEKAARAL